MNAEARRWLFPFLVLLISACFILPGLGAAVMNREQELRVALTARDMLDRGDWLHPVFLGEPRLRKPPLMYWLVAASYQVVGNAASTAAARLPSALAALFFTVLFYAASSRELGRQRAAVAALICATSLIFLKQAHLAETDLVLMLCAATATWSVYLAMKRSPNPGAWILAGLAAGIGFMTKGPAAIVLPSLAGVTFFASSLRARKIRPKWGPFIALAVCAAIALPWYLLVFRESTAALQIEDELARATTSSKHSGPFYYYFYTLIHALLPWGLLLPVALVHGYRKRHKLVIRFALCWLGSSFLALSLISSKQIHYALLLVPPAGLLSGNFLGSALAGRGKQRLAANRWLKFMTGLLAISGLVFLVAPLIFGLPRIVLPFAALALAAGLSGSRIECPPTRRLILFIAGLWAISYCASSIIQPVSAKEVVIRDAVLDARESLRAAPRAFMVGPRNAIAEFYAGRRIEVVDSLDRAWNRMQPDDALVLVEIPAAALTPPGKPISIRQGEEMQCAVFVKP